MKYPPALPTQPKMTTHEDQPGLLPSQPLPTTLGDLRLPSRGDSGRGLSPPVGGP